MRRRPYRVTVVLTDKKIIANAEVRLTGAALDDQESEPGPDHAAGRSCKGDVPHICIRPIGNP